ncbi:MAG: hypothetical protein LUF81_01365 [Clostridiales bacterium]|nr:hypothetical protein [Clostridiales bacterium]
MEERYIRQSELRAFLRKQVVLSRRRAKAALELNRDESMGKNTVEEKKIILLQRAEEEMIVELWRWASENSCRGELVLFTGEGPGASGETAPPGPKSPESSPVR